MKRILYLSPNHSTFVQKDIEILSSEFKVKLFEYFYPAGAKQVLYLLLQPFRLVREIGKIDCVLIMFGGLWAFWPVLLGKLFGKPVAIILGGTDCVAFPYLNYGYFSKWYLKLILNFEYTYADFLIPVHESLVKQSYSYDSQSKFTEQGYKAFLPKNKTPYQVVHNGYKHIELTQKPGKKDQFLSIIPADKMNRALLKGIPEIINLAKNFVQYEFIVIGCKKEIINKFDVPVNLEIIPFLPFEQLTHYFLESRYYLQLSISEGFPNSLCEAMMYECIPIGSHVGGIPTIIDNTGIIIKHKIQTEINQAVTNALSLSEEKRQLLGSNARKRIIENFPIELRQQKLILILDELIQKKQSINY